MKRTGNPRIPNLLANLLMLSKRFSAMSCRFGASRSQSHSAYSRVRVALSSGTATVPRPISYMIPIVYRYIDSYSVPVL